MKIKEIKVSETQFEALQSASKPLSPEQARVRAIKQHISLFPSIRNSAICA